MPRKAPSLVSLSFLNNLTLYNFSLYHFPFYPHRKLFDTSFNIFCPCLCIIRWTFSSNRDGNWIGNFKPTTSAVRIFLFWFMFCCVENRTIWRLLLKDPFLIFPRFSRINRVTKTWVTFFTPCEILRRTVRLKFPL